MIKAAAYPGLFPLKTWRALVMAATVVSCYNKYMVTDNNFFFKTTYIYIYIYTT